MRMGVDNQVVTSSSETLGCWESAAGGRCCSPVWGGDIFDRLPRQSPLTYTGRRGRGREARPARRPRELMTEIAILNGTVIDGTGAGRFKADVLISGDRIAAVGDLSADTSARRIDASGRIVAPGFVDTHNHTDAWLLRTPHLPAKTSQGFTTEVIMADGISYAPVDPDTAPEWIFYMKSLNALSYSEYDGWKTLGEYMDRVDGANVQNAVAHIPYANVRSMACGFGRGLPDDYQMTLIRREIERGMAAGAVGVSTGLDYISQCFATTDELVEACEVMAGQRGLYVTHMRYRKGIVPALEEAVEIGRRAKVPVHVSHLKAADPAAIEQVLEYVDGNRAPRGRLLVRRVPLPPGQHDAELPAPVTRSGRTDRSQRWGNSRIPPCEGSSPPTSSPPASPTPASPGCRARRTPAISAAR